MPSPFGHTLAGLAIGWSAEARTRTRLALVCTALAVMPDADLLFHAHRGISHSAVGVLIVMIVTIGVTRWVTGRIAWGTVFICGAAYGSHLAIDWLSVDINVPSGIQFLWPLRRWYIAPWPIFPMTERDNPLSPAGLMRNGTAAFVELALIGPFAWAAWAMRKRRSRARISDRDVRRQPSGEVVGMGGISDPQIPGA